MAAVTLLLVVLRLYRMDTDEVAAVTAGMGIPAKVFFFEIGTVQQATLMAIKTPGLVVALAAVIAGFAGQYPVATDKISIMVGCHAFALMAGAALTNLHFGVFGVGLFFAGIGLLLHKYESETKQCYDKYNFFHVCPPFLKV